LGAEIKKTRPCVVISPPELHEHLRTVLVAPLTSKGFAAPFRVAVSFSEQDGLLLLDQIRSVDKQRLVKWLGSIDNATLLETLARLREMFEV
jgi:mRNA interferase MazF